MTQLGVIDPNRPDGFRDFFVLLHSSVQDFDLAKLARFFAGFLETKVWIAERALLPTASLSHSDVAVAELTNSENRKVLL